MTGIAVGVAIVIAAITATAWIIRRTVWRTHIDDGIARLEALANHPAGRQR